MQICFYTEKTQLKMKNTPWRVMKILHDGGNLHIEVIQYRIAIFLCAVKFLNRLNHRGDILYRCVGLDIVYGIKHESTIL